METDGRALHSGSLICIKGTILEFIYSPTKQRMIIKLRSEHSIKQFDLLYQQIPWEEHPNYINKSGYFQLLKSKGEILGIADFLINV